MTDDNLARDREQEKLRRLLILTEEDDAPGVNAVVRAFVKTATELGMRVYGSDNGFAGLIEKPVRLVRLTPATVRGILPRGGSVLGGSNEAGLASQSALGGAQPRAELCEQIKEALQEHEIDVLVCVGGEGTLGLAMHLAKQGVSVVGVPKAIENDLAGTDMAFGLDTAVAIATQTVDALHTNGEAHQQVMVLEVMGRRAGWIALMSGIAGGADVILLPEIAYDIDRVVDKIRQRADAGRRFSIIVVAEGARPAGGTVSSINEAHESAPQREVGAALQLARLLDGRIDLEVRVTALGHLQREGSPSPFDRLLGTRFGVHAAELCYHDNTCQIVALRGQDIVAMPLEAAVANHKRVPPDGELVGIARSIGIELGQE